MIIADPTTERWRDRLVGLGFTDDGVRLRGPVSWHDPALGMSTARVAITPDDTFPYKPPTVVILDPGAPLGPTFHLERSGALCLWDIDWAVDEAPWRDPETLLKQIAGWLEATAAGWPDDDVCDLERYLEPDQDVFVLYDATALVLDAAVRTTPGRAPGTRVVTGEKRRVGDIRSGRRPGRKDRRLAWVADLGAVGCPLRNWTDVAAALGDRAGEVERLIHFGVVTLVLLRYNRGDRSGVLALTVRPAASGIQVAGCESADTSTGTRQVRAGPAAEELADVSIAVVGCGAVGSFAADLLFRSGVRHLTLVDGERLRPGNLVRHLAGETHVGRYKVDAVRDRLSAIGLDTAEVTAHAGSVTTLDCAIGLVRRHQVVLDATGNARASSLLATAADVTGRSVGHTVVSACVQRDGDVVRVDRLPLREGETYLLALPLRDDSAHPREQGCGSPVSLTPPGAVLAAAELAHRVVIDEATRECALPASIAEVRHAQPEHPYQRIGRVTSENAVAQVTT